MKPSDVELLNQQRENVVLPLFEQACCGSAPTEEIHKSEVLMRDEPRAVASGKRPANTKHNTKFLIKNLETSTTAGSHDGPAGKAHARRTDPATSKAAAKSVVNLGRTREQIIHLLKILGPLTDEQINKEINERAALWPHRYNVASPSGLRSRRSELVRMGFVEACGEGKTVSGRPCQIWRLRK